MKISATIKNENGRNETVVSTNNNEQQLNIAAKKQGSGSSINGGELLFLALATCFCNDIYREAAKRQMQIDGVEVQVSGEFGNEGEPACNISYQVKIVSPASTEEIYEMVLYVDQIAEVHNTLRRGATVALKQSSIPGQTGFK